MGGIVKAGKRDRLITIERDSGTSENAFGEITPGWASLATAYAQVIYGSGDERRQSANEGAEQSVTFRVLANTDTLSVTTADRIVFNGDNWDIVNISPLLRDGIEYTATRRTSA